MNSSRRNDNFRILFGYLACVTLIPFYVNMFPLWKYLTTAWGDEVFILIPPLALIVLLGCGLLLLRRRQQLNREAISVTPIIIGILFCLMGLVIPDPDFPIKRIHVAEYLILSAIARYAMSHRLQGIPLMVFSACFASLLGVHDEFLQGLHPARTFGLRDMLVNCLGSFGGSLIWYGARSAAKDEQSKASKIDWLYTSWLLFSVAALVLPSAFYRGLTLPFWPALPLIGAVIYFFMYSNRFSRRTKHGIWAISGVSFTLLFYPLLTHLPSIVFY